MNHGPVIILFRGRPVRFYRAGGNNVCELCTPDAATVFATPANARAKAILHRFAFEDYCMAEGNRDSDLPLTKLKAANSEVSHAGPKADKLT